MLTNTSPYRLDLHISKDYILQSKGLSHRLMDPHAVSTLLFRLKTAFLDYMHVLTPLKEQHWKPFIFSVSNIQEKLQDSRSVYFLPLIPRIQSGTSE
jgi:hypothetical protein